MRLGFQHMGHVHIPLRAFLEGMGIELRLGPLPNRKTLEIGARYSPEMVCLPFKITLGDLIQSLERGADTLLFIGSGDWSCRFGYYGRVQCAILKKMGYRFKEIFISRDELGVMFNEVVAASEGRLFRAIHRCFYSVTLASLKSMLIERVEQWARKIRALEKRDGQCDKESREFLEQINVEQSIVRLCRMFARIDNTFSGIECDQERDPVRVLITGESYCVIEPLVNFNIVDYLGHSGVFVEPFLTTHRWLFRHALRIDPNKQLKCAKAMQLAEPFWACGTGGEDQVNVGHLLSASKRGFDGVIHLMPFGCMPETAVLPVLESISRSSGVPLLNISLDEHSGHAGIATRIEAFIDLLEQQKIKKKQIKRGDKKSALSSGS